MKKENIIAILGILKTAYPRFYANMTKNEAEETIALWYEMFKSEDIRILTLAVKRLITHLEFPPTIADIKKEIVKMTSKDESVMDYWQYVVKMMGKANYMQADEFEQYPEICKRFFGSVGNLRPYGMMEQEYTINNIQSRFIKFAENYQKEQNERKMLPPEFNSMVDKLINDMETKQIGGK